MNSTRPLLLTTLSGVVVMGVVIMAWRLWWCGGKKRIRKVSFAETMPRRKSKEGEEVEVEAEAKVSLSFASAAEKQEVRIGATLLEILASVKSEKEEIVVNAKKVSELHEIYVVDNVLSKEECQAIIELTEGLGAFSFWDQTGYPSGPDQRAQFRNADTIEITDEEFAKFLWERIDSSGGVIPRSVDLVGRVDDPRWQRDMNSIWTTTQTTNPKILVARYAEGGHFAPHTDGFQVFTFNDRSIYSIVLYLNDITSGGETVFYSDEMRDNFIKDQEGRFRGREELKIASIEARAGRAAIFFHNIMHESIPVVPGRQETKYIIRSDVMYQRDPPILTTPNDIEAFRLYQAAEDLSNQGNLEQASQLLRRCTKLSPGLADIYGL